MKQMELEVKVLDINEDELIKKIESLGGKFVDKYNQYLYVYDMPTIYGRFIDILTTLNTNESKVRFETGLYKLNLLFFDVDNLLNSENKKELFKIVGTEKLQDLIGKDNILEILNKKELNDFLRKFVNNQKKWIRLRQTKDTTTIAIKHVLADDGSGIQQMQETEIEVPSIKEANELLEGLGFAYRSYQEKRRISYEFNGYEIDIDTWPGIPTYMEVEGESEEKLDEFLKLLGYSIKNTVSCTADEIYKMYGIDNILEVREIKF